MGESATDPKDDTKVLDRQGQRVSCPACGHFMLRFTAIDQGSNVMQEQNCKKCHARIGVTLNAGKITLAIL